MTDEPATLEQIADGTGLACRVYGVVPAGTALPELGGTEAADRNLRLVEYDQVAAVIEAVDPERQTAKRSDLVAHSVVLNGIAATGSPVVPVKFGSVAQTGDAVADELIAPRHEHWRRVLDDLRGTTQFTLRGRYVRDVVLTEIVRENPQIAELREATAGRSEEESYPKRVRLGELVAAAVDAKRSADVETVMAALSPHAVSQKATVGSGIDGVVDAAFLVEDERRPSFERAAEELAQQVYGRIDLKLLGPLAPFDFVPEA